MRAAPFRFSAIRLRYYGGDHNIGRAVFSSQSYLPLSPSAPACHGAPVQISVKLATAIAVIALLSACSDDRPWAAYALRDAPGPDDLRILGTFANAGTCRQGALAADSDPDHESLVCARDCPRPRNGILTDCAETQVIRVPEVAIPVEEQRGAAPI
jgi:hypothetical protein